MKDQKKTRQYRGHINIARQTCSILIWDLNMHPLFVFYFYGVTKEELCTIGEDYSGGDIVAAALRRRGLDPADYQFTIWDVGP